MAGVNARPHESRYRKSTARPEWTKLDFLPIASPAVINQEPNSTRNELRSLHRDNPSE